MFKNMQRYFSSSCFIVRNIFNDIFYIFRRDWFKRKLYLLFNFKILGLFWKFLIIAAACWSFNKSVLFEGHSKIFDVSTISVKCLLKVLAISSLFTSKVFFLITSFELLVIFSFSIRIILESPRAYLLEK